MGNFKMGIKYSIERISEGKCNFNLWAKKDKRYYSVASLFFKDYICRDQWDIVEIEKAVSYGEEEIRDELESPLIDIDKEDAEKLLSMSNNSPSEVASFFESLYLKPFK